MRVRLLTWLGLLGTVAIAGIYAAVQRIAVGLAMTNLTSMTPWGAWVAFYIFFVGLSAGAFLLSTLVYVFGMRQFEKVGRDALLTALVSMVVALGFVLMDLGRMDRFWYPLIYWNQTSVLAWEIRFYGLYILLLATELYLSLRVDLVRRATQGGWKGRAAKWLLVGKTEYTDEHEQRDHRRLKVLGTVGIPLAIFGVHGGTGLLFGVVQSRAYWHGALFPVLFVVSALVSGTALLTAIYVIRHRAAGKPVDKSLVAALGQLMTLFLFVELGLEFFAFVVEGLSLEPSVSEVLATMMQSEFSWSFWIVQMFVGAVVPLFLVFFPKTRDTTGGITAAAVCIVLGIIGVRFNIVVPNLIVPVMEGLPWSYYAPTTIEWMSSAGLFSLGLILYTLGVLSLPIDTREISEGGTQSCKTNRPAV